MMSRSCENNVLRTLQELENNDDRDLKDKEAESHHEKEIIELQEEVQRLRNRRNLLQNRLASQNREMLEDFVNNMDNTEYLNNSKKQNSKKILQIVDEIRCKKFEDLCAAYRLTGVSIESDTPSKVNFRLDTFHKGQSRESYYIEIKSENLLTVSQHTIPYSIPLSDIEQRYLNTDIQQFFIELLKLLNAHGSRTST